MFVSAHVRGGLLSLYTFFSGLPFAQARIVARPRWLSSYLASLPDFRELRKSEVELRRIPLPRTPVKKGERIHNLSDVLRCIQPVRCPRIYWGRHFFGGSGKEVKDCWDNRRAPKRHTMAAFSENSLRESMW